ncbi:hypothetical protein [Sporichthya sp.]|uniref:hypothetical protein n=1 Tax=Sporichthya sp. TaxID=65475 RepID=UPI0017DC87E3|nr:hypothetical protein [Sporichthya sp.]MBA3742572.1 hypothetical protein [Sporichthya sp.]
MDDVWDNVEQYTEQSAQELVASAIQLISLIRHYTDEAVSMHGDSAELSELTARNRSLADAVAAFNDRAFVHTGTRPLLLDVLDEDIV